MKKAVCIRDWRPAKLKEGEFSGGARSGKLSGCKIFKLHHAQIQILNKKVHSSSTASFYKETDYKKLFSGLFYLSACLSFSSLCPVCMCGCGGDNGGCQPAPPSLPSSPQTQTFPFIEHFPFLPGGLYSCRKLCVAFYLSREKGELASFRKFQPSSTFPFSMFCQLFL